MKFYVILVLAIIAIGCVFFLGKSNSEISDEFIFCNDSLRLGMAETDLKKIGLVHDGSGGHSIYYKGQNSFFWTVDIKLKGIVGNRKVSSMALHLLLDEVKANTAAFNKEIEYTGITISDSIFNHDFFVLKKGRYYIKYLAESETLYLVLE